MEMENLWQAFGDKVQNILPLSPFRSVIQSIEQFPYLGWLNWLFPVHEVLVVTAAWLSCIAIFYLAQVVLRWIKVIGS